MSPRADKIVEQTSPNQVEVERIHLQPHLLDDVDIVVDHFSPQQQASETTAQSTTGAEESEKSNKLITTEKNTLFGYEMPFDVASSAYAALVATGGIIGYLKAGSVPSLMAGLAFGSVLGAGAYMTSVNPDNYHLTLGTATALGGFMGYRFFQSGKFMPAGLITLLSVGMVLRFSIRALTHSQHYKK